MEDVMLLILILSGFLSLPSSSEFYLVNERRTWAEAQRHCRENSSDLASVHHDGDSRRLLMAAGRSGDSGRSAWIGLFDESTVWKLSEDASLEVNTDSLDWMKEQPNNFAGSQYCLYITQTGILNDFFCSTPFHFICYDDRNASRYVLVEVKLSWSEAQAYCRGRHTDLMSLRSREEQEDVRRSLKWAGDVWVGLYRDPWASWSDGSASSFSDWKATQPDNQGRDRQCAAVLLHTGKWVDENCREEKPFFCFKAETKLKRLKMTMRTVADMNDVEIQQQLLQQLRAHILLKGLKVSRMFWGKIQKKEEEK